MTKALAKEKGPSGTRFGQIKGLATADCSRFLLIADWAAEGMLLA